MPERDILLNDVNDRVNEPQGDELGILNANIQNAPVNDNVVKSNRYNLKLSESENAARESGYLDSEAGINRSSWDDVINSKRRNSSVGGGQSDTDEEDTGYSDIDYTVSDETENLNSYDLYRTTLGYTKYDDLKQMCGLSKDESFTDFYNRTKYIPKGYEMEARLALAEEKRMKLYVEYQEGKISKTDFLYQAYGKDLLKADGYDFENTLYWYNRHKEGKYDNPLDDDMLLTNVINAANELFEAENFYKEMSGKKLSNSLTGMVTGQTLSTEKVHSIFGDQLDAIAEAMNESVNKVLTYYKSGNLSQAFNPFIDSDNDGKYDYYYHTDGKLYAVEGGSADDGLSRNLTAKIEYTDKDSGDGLHKVVHQVEINDGATGFAGAFGEGMMAFATGIFDILTTLSVGLGWVVTGGFGSGYSSKSFADPLVEYDSWKNSFMGNDVQVFDGAENADTAWGRGIGEVTGIIIEQVVLAIATWGAGNAATMGARGAAEAGKQGLKALAVGVGKGVAKAAAGAAVGAGVGALVGGITGGSKGAQEGAIGGLSIGGAIGGALGIKNITKGAVESGSKAALKGTQKFVQGVTTLLQSTGKVRAGIPLGKTPVTQIASITAQNFVKDMFQTMGTLSAQNFQLSYMVKEAQKNGQDLGLKELTTGDILLRSFGLAAVNAALTFVLRAYGSSTMSSRGAQMFKGSELSKALSVNPKASAAIKMVSVNTAGWNFADNLADVTEGLLSAGMTAAMSNAYAQDAGSWWSSFGNAYTNPTTWLMAAYSFANNQWDLEKLGGSSIASDKNKYIAEGYAEIDANPLLTQAYRKIVNDNGIGSDEANNIKSVIKYYNDGCAGKLEITKGKTRAEAIAIMNIEIAGIFGDGETIDYNIVKEAYNLNKDEIDNVKKIMHTMAGNEENKGDIIAAIVTGNVKKKTLEDAYRLFNEGFKHATTRSLNFGNKIAAVVTGKENPIDEETKKEYGKFQAKMVTLFNRVIEEGYAKNRLNNYSDLLDSNGERLDFSKVLPEDYLDYVLVKDRIIDVDDNTRKNYLETFDKYIDTKVFNRDTIAGSIDIDVTVENDKLVFKSKGTGKEVSSETLLRKSPLLYILSHPEIEGHTELVDYLRLNKGFPESGDPEELKAWIEKNQSIIAFRIKSENHNDLQGDDEGKKIIETLSVLSKSMDAKDGEGNLLFNFAKPLLIEIKVPTGGKTDSGKADYETFYVLSGDINNSLLEELNTYQIVPLLVRNIMALGDSRILNKGTTIDERAKAYRTALINIGYLADGFDSVHGTNKYNIGDDEELDKLYLEKGLDIVLNMSSFFKTEDGKESGVFNKAQLMNLYSLGVLNEEALGKIANTTIATDGKDTYKYSEKSRNIAKEMLDYNKAVKDLDNIIPKMRDIAERMEKGEKVNLTYTDIEKFQKLITDLKKEENKKLLNSLKEIPGLEKFLTKVEEDPDSFINFSQGLLAKLDQLSALAIGGNVSDAEVKEAFDSISVVFNKENLEVEFNAAKVLSKRFFSSIKEDANRIFEHRKTATDNQGQKIFEHLNKISVENKDLYPELESLLNELKPIYDARNESETWKKYVDSLKQLKEMKDDPLYKSIEKKIKARKETKDNSGKNLWDTWFKKANSYETDSAKKKAKTREYHAKYEALKHSMDFTEEEVAFLEKRKSIYDSINEIKESGTLDSLKIDNNKKARAKEIFGIFAENKKWKEQNQAAISQGSLAESLYVIANSLDIKGPAEFEVLFTEPSEFFVKMRAKAELMEDGSKKEKTLKSIEFFEQMFTKYDVFMVALQGIDSSITNNKTLYDFLTKSKNYQAVSMIRMAIQTAVGETDVWDNNKLSYNKDTGIITYKGKNISEGFANNTNASSKIVLETKTIKEQINSDLKLLRSLVYFNTTMKDSENKIIVNVLDMLPEKYISLMKLSKQQIDFLNNYKDFNDDIKITEIKKSIRNISGGSSLNGQQRAFLNFFVKSIENNTLVFEMSISELYGEGETKAGKSFRKLLEVLGYKKDFIGMLNGVATIPGITVLNKTTRAVDSKVLYDDFVDNVLKNTTVERTNVKDENPSYSNNIVGMFGVNYIDETSTFKLDSSDKYLSITRNKNSETGEYDVEFTDFSELLIENIIKQGVAGGDFAKVRSFLSESGMVTGEQDATSRNTFIAYSLIESVFKYIDGEYKNLAFTFKANKEAKEKIKKFYKEHDYSLFIPVEKDQAGEITFVLNTKITKEEFLKRVGNSFDLKTLFPLFGKTVNIQLKGNKKNPNIVSNSEYWNPVNILHNSGFEEFEDVDAMIAYADSPKAIQTFDETEYETFLKEVKADNSEDISVEKVLNYKKTNNYYIESLRFTIESSVAISKKAKANLQNLKADSLMKFANYENARTLGSLFDFGKTEIDGVEYKYEDLITGKLEGDIALKVKENLVKEYNDKINNESKEQVKVPDQPRLYTGDVTGFDSVKLNAYTKTEDATVNDIDLLLNIINKKKSIYISDYEGLTLPKHNSLINALSCVRVNSDGTLYVNIDTFIELPRQDRLILIKSLQGFDQELSKILILKDKQYAEISGDQGRVTKDLEYIQPDDKYTSVVHEVQAPNAATIKQFRTLLVREGLSDAQSALISELVLNRDKLNNARPKYTNVSSMLSIRQDEMYDEYTQMYLKLINENLIPSVDKAGHAKVFNFNSSEAISEFILSFASFKKAIKNFELTKDGVTYKPFEKMSTEDLRDLYMKANLYTTGIDKTAESSSTLYIEIDNNGKLTIKPIESSTMNRGDAIISELLLDKDINLHNIRNDKEKEHFLIMLEPNSFAATPSGYDSSFKVLSLDDQKNVDGLLAEAGRHAIKQELRDPTIDISQSDYKNLIMKYYKRKLTISRMYDHLVKKLERQGVSSAVSRLIRQSVASLDVSSRTTLSEEQFNTHVMKYIISNQEQISSVEMQKLNDIFVHRVTYDALNDKTKESLENEVIKITSQEGFESFVEDFADDYLSPDVDNKVVLTSLRSKLEGKTEEEQERIVSDFVKLIILKRGKGQDLAYVLGANDTSLSAYKESIYVEDDVLGSLEFKHSESLLDAFSKKWAVLDTENFIPKNEETSKDYRKIIKSKKYFEIGVVVGEGVDLNALDPNDREALSKQAKEKHVFLIKPAFNFNVVGKLDDKKNYDSSDSFYYVGEKDNFENLRDIANGVKKAEGEVIYHVIDGSSYEEAVINAIKEVKTLLSGSSTLIGFNNKEVGIDDDFFKTYDATFFNGKDDLDVLRDVSGNIETDPKKDNSHSTFGRRALQTIKEKDFIPAGNKDTAHEGVSDCLDTLNYIQFLWLNKKKTDDLYKVLPNEVENILKELGYDETLIGKFFDSFKFETNLGTEENKELIKSIDYKNIKHGNYLLASLLNDFRAVLEHTDQRVVMKKYRAEVQEIIDRYGFDYDFIEMVTNDGYKKNLINTIYYNTMSLINKDVNNLTKDDFETLNRVVTKALDVYKQRHEKEIKEKTKREYITNNEVLQSFLMDTPTEIENCIRISQLKKDPIITIPNDFKLSEVRTQKEIDTFIEKQKKHRSELKHLNIMDRESDEFNAVMYRFTNGVAKHVIEAAEKFDNIEEDLINDVLFDVFRFANITKDSRKRLAEQKEVNAKREINPYYYSELFSGIDLKSKEKIFELFREKLYSCQSLYSMACENINGQLKPNWNEFDDEHDFASFGTVFISENLFNISYSNAGYTLDAIQETDEAGHKIYYTRVWRQPLEQKTGLQILRIVVLKDNEATAPISMSRTTAKTFFNGDFDGDFYYFEPPVEGSITDTQTKIAAVNKYKAMWQTETEPLSMMVRGLLANTTSVENEKFFNSKQRKDIQETSDKLRNEFLETLNNIDSVDSLKDLFTQELKDKGYDDDFIKSAWDAYGVVKVYTRDNQKYVYSNNPIFASDENAFKQMQANRQFFMHYPMIFASDIESIVIGETAKQLLVDETEATKGTPGEMFYHSNISFTEETGMLIAQRLTTKENKAAVANNLKTIINNLESKGFITKTKVGLLNNFIEQNINDLTLNHVVIVMNILQNSLYASKRYNDSMMKTLKLFGVGQQNTELLNKYKFVAETVNGILGLEKDKARIRTDYDNMSNFEMLDQIAKAFHLVINDDQFKTITYLKINGNQALESLFEQAIERSKEEDMNGMFAHKNLVKVIGFNKEEVKTNESENRLGLGKAIVAVRKDREVTNTDTIISTKDNKQTVMLICKEGYDIRNKTSENIEGLKSAIKKDEKNKIQGSVLNKILNTSDFNNFMEYTIHNVDSLDTDRRIVYSASDSLNNIIRKGNYAKVANKSGKMGKGTVSVSDIEFEGDIQPEYIFSPTLLKDKNFSIGTNLTPIGETKGTKDDVEYELYELNDLSLVSTQLDTDISFSTRDIDLLGIIQTSRAPAAAISYGEYFWTISKNEKGKDVLEYNPTYFNAIQQEINSKNKPISEANAVKQINFFKLYTLLSAKEGDSLQKAFIELGIPADYRDSLNNALKYLYSIRDLGGNYGDTRISLLENSIISNDEELNKFISIRDSNPILKAAFSKELDSERRKREVASSERDVNKLYTSKNKPTTTNQRTSIQRTRTPRNESSLSPFFDTAIPVTNGFVGRVRFLEKIAEEANGDGMKVYIPKEQLQQLAYLMPEYTTQEGINGSVLNGFESISVEEALINSGRPWASEVDKKTGATEPISSSKQISPDYSLHNFISSSIFDDNIEYHDGIRKYNPENSSQHLPNFADVTSKYIIGNRGNTPQTMNAKALLAISLMGVDGSQESLVGALSNDAYRMSGSIGRKAPTLGDDRIILDTYQARALNKKVYAEEDTFKDFLIGETGSYRKNVIRRDLEIEDIENLNKLDDTEIGTKIKMIHSDNLKESNKHLGRLISLYKLIDQDEFNAHKMYQIELDDAYDAITEEDVTRMCQLFGEENGIKLVNSYLRTVGFKDESGRNRDLSLGRTVIQLEDYRSKVLKQILGNEYTIIMSAFKKDKLAFTALNKYWDIKLKLDSYNKLADEKSNLRKQYSKKKYEELLLKAKTNLGLSENATERETREHIAKLLASQKELVYSNEVQDLINMTKKIALRLEEIGNQLHPFAIIQYHLPIVASKKKKLKWEHTSEIMAHKASAFNNLDFLNNNHNGDHFNSYEQMFQIDGVGVIGNMLRVAEEYSTDLTMAHFKKRLCEEGYMRNSEVVFKARGILEAELEKLFVTVDDIEHPRYEHISEYKKTIYKTLKYQIESLTCKSLCGEYLDNSSFRDLYDSAKRELNEYLQKFIDAGIITTASMSELYDAYRKNSNTVNKESFEYAMKLNDAYQRIMATLVQVHVESNHPDIKNSANEILIKVYDAVAAEANSLNCSLVDDRGCKIKNGIGKESIATYKLRDVDGMIREITYGKFSGGEEQAKKYLAQMMLQGDVFMMDTSVADQLVEKVFTKELPGTFRKILNKVKNLTTSLIMSSPVALIDRIINFTGYDYGTLAQCGPGMELYLPDAVMTVQKFFAAKGNISETSLKYDDNMQLLIRYLAQSAYDPTSNGGYYQGEKFDMTKIPGVKEIFELANNEFGKQNLYARFAYFMMMAKSAEKHGYEINYNKTGAAYHMREGISKITGDASLSSVYGLDDADTAKQKARIDAQITEVIDQNLGSVTGMPYLSKTLSKYGLCFTSFPLALVRWGANSLLSLGSSFADFSSTGWKYLGNKALGTALSYALMLALQTLFSPSLQEYIFGDKEEMTEEEIDNAEKILFRGGSVQLFKTAITGQESASSSQSRGPVSSIFDNYVAEFVPMFQTKDDQSFMESFWNVLKTNVWSKANPLIKDPIESIPGNTALQSTTWYEPEDNWLHNMQRKIMGYALGASQADAFIDSWRADEYTDKTFMNKLQNGFTNAYINKSTNLKESKSAFKNYKKAFSIMYEYNTFVNQNDDDLNAMFGNYYGSSNFDSEDYKDMRAEIINCLNNAATADSIYKVIAKYKNNGTSLETIRSVMNNVSLKAKIDRVGDERQFLNYLSPKQSAVIKTALAYEDYNFPFLEDIADDLNQQYLEYLRSQNKYSSYANTLSNMLYRRNVNTPKNYGYNKYRNSNYKNYQFLNSYLNNINYRNNYKNYNNDPMETYNQMMRTKNYGTSTDIWGNRYTRYTNSEGDKWTYNVAADKED